MSNSTVFSTQVITGLKVQVTYSQDLEKKDSVKTVSLVFPDMKDKKGNELSIARRAFSGVSKFQEVAEKAGLWNDAVAGVQLSTVHPALATAVSSATEFVAGLNEALEAYDSEMAPEQAGIVRPENGLANFICSLIPASDFETLTPEQLASHVEAHFAKAMTISTKRAKENGTKASGLVLMRKETAK